MAISDQAFSQAQKEELQDWSEAASDPSRILRALSQHTDVVAPLRKIIGQSHVERALEVGVGPYGIGFLAVHLGATIRSIDGLEPLPRLDLRFADENLTDYVHAIQNRVRYIVAPGEKMPMEPNSYDLVACVNVLDHTQDPEKILREIERVLKPGGMFAFSMNTLSFLGEIKWKLNRKRKPTDFIFVAHPHTYQWATADRLLGTMNTEVLWHDRPKFLKRFAGHGALASWIFRKR